MEQQLLTKLLQTTEETNKTVNIMASAIITMQQDISGLKDDVAGLKQDVANLKQDVAELKQDIEEIKKEQVRMKIRIEELNDKIENEMKDAALNDKILFKNLNITMNTLNLKMTADV